jgi:hypothetical protein
MSADIFWQLGWYDLSLWIEKIWQDRKKRNEERELTMEMTRQQLCLFYNANRGKDSPVRYPQDFIRLSYDVDREEQKPNDEDLTERLERLKKLFPDDKK